MHKKRKEEWEKGQVQSPDFKKVGPEERGYKVDEVEDVRGWKKGKLLEILKKPVEELGVQGG